MQGFAYYADKCLTPGKGLLPVYIRKSHLPYYERSHGEFRDLREVTLTANKHFARISINGQYCGTRNYHEIHRRANPGWSFGLDNTFINWVHFHNHCWHLSFTIAKRGITFSYGKWW